MEEEKNTSEKTSSKSRKGIYAGILATVLAVSSFGGYKYFQSEEVPTVEINQVESSKGIGLIDLQRIQSKHPDGERLSELRRIEVRLRLELKDAMQPITLNPPKVDEKPFDDSVWQKNAQTIIGEAAEIRRRKKQSAEEYKKSTEEEYLKKRDDINNQFLNEILNINLKLQNADNMRLTVEQVSNLKEQLKKLQIERGKIHEELTQQWTKEIEEHADEAVKDDIEKLRSQAHTSMDKLKADAEKSRLKAEQRNKALMEMAMKESATRQENRQRIILELQETVKERTVLENKILKDINDEAMKLAVIHKLELVLTKRPLEDSEKFLPFDFDFDFVIDKKLPLGAAILANADAIDLTDELLKELERSGIGE